MTANTHRPALTFADADFLCAVECAGLVRGFFSGMAQTPTADSERATRAAAHRAGLPVRESSRPTASEKRDAAVKRRADALGLTGQTHAARQQQTDFTAHAARVFADFYRKHGHPGRNV